MLTHLKDRPAWNAAMNGLASETAKIKASDSAMFVIKQCPQRTDDTNNRRWLLQAEISSAESTNQCPSL